jgi:hypothetical protein
MTGDKVDKETMALGHLSDIEMAGKVRMLYRTDLDHEAICVGSRDRIMYLSQEVERLTALCQSYMSTEGEIPTREENIKLQAEVERLMAPSAGMASNGRRILQRLQEASKSFVPADECRVLAGVDLPPGRVEVLNVDPDIFGVGDFVSRDGSDIHYVEGMNEAGDLVDVVCIVAPSSDWTEPGQWESNLFRRYSRINRHLLPFARSEHSRLKEIFTSGWLKA